VLQIFNPGLLCPLCASLSRGFSEIGTLRKYQQPHWKIRLVEILEVLRHLWLILLPIPFQEYELGEPHSPANHWYPAQRLFQNDENAPMHAITVCNPPQVQPVGVNLIAISSFVLLACTALKPGDWQ
jgi:hypothetical protein